MSWTRDRARVAALTRSRPADDPELVEARRAMRVGVAEDYLARLLASTPPPIVEQRAHLARLLTAPGLHDVQVTAGASA